MAMFGAVFVYLRRERFTERTVVDLAYYSARRASAAAAARISYARV